MYASSQRPTPWRPSSYRAARSTPTAFGRGRDGDRTRVAYPDPAARSATERTLHWVNATGFLLLLESGLSCSCPAVGARRPRPLIRTFTLGRIGWISASHTRRVLGDRRGLLRTAREIETFQPSRFNVGQKVNRVLNARSPCCSWAAGCCSSSASAIRASVCEHGRPPRRAPCTPRWGFRRHLYLAVIHPATRHSLAG